LARNGNHFAVGFRFQTAAGIGR